MPAPIAIGFLAGIGTVLTAYLGVALTNFLLSLGLSIAIFGGAQLIISGAMAILEAYVSALPLFVRQMFYYLHADIIIDIVLAAAVLAFSFKRVRIVPAAG